MGASRTARAACVLTLIAAASWAAPARVSLQFDVPLSVEQAPFYLGLMKGAYSAAGIDAALLPGTDQASTIEAVSDGRADIGIADVSSVCAARAQGMRLRIVASLGDGSGLCAYSLSSRGIKKPGDLSGKKVAVDPFDAGRVLFPLLALNNGFRATDVTFLPMPLAERIGALASGAVDAVFGSISDNRMLAKAVGEGALSHFLWADFSFIPYGRCMFVKESALSAKPGAIRSFLSAAFKAWALALKDPDQAAAALDKYRVVPPDMSVDISGGIEDLLPLFATTAYRTKGIGFMDPARMEATLKAAFDLQGIALHLTVADVMNSALLPNPPVKMPAAAPTTAAPAPVTLRAPATPAPGTTAPR